MIEDNKNETQFQIKAKANYGKAKTFDCPSCGGLVTLKAVGNSLSAVCQHCSSIIDTANENYQIILKDNQKTIETLLEIGARGKLFNIEWEVIGYTQKSDGSEFYWDEYLLYNPYYGFRFLIQSEGHWNFAKVIKETINGIESKSSFNFEGREYKLFLRGNSITEYVKGEFYWQVSKGEKTKCADYISSPYMISTESSADEINISLSEYINPSQIEEAFNIANQMPRKIGVGANQPAPFQNQLKEILSIAFVAALIAFLVQIIFVNICDNANLNLATDLNDNQFKNLDSQENTIVSKEFNIPEQSNILVTSFAPVSNDWVEIGFSLVNVATGQTYNFTQPIEYYFGYDSDGGWTEGSQRAKTFISTVQKGNYRFLIDVDAGQSFKNQISQLSINAKRDVAPWSNFFIVMLLILAYPVLALVIRWRFEIDRWSNSDYAPAIYNNS